MIGRIFDFNSIKVRLERAWPPPSHRRNGVFQFHKGAIRTYCSAPLYRLRQDFNSIKVRLELVITYFLYRCSPFQFHKGAIRTLHPRRAPPLPANFNSIKVRLELTLPFMPCTIMLNFNSIKVRLEPSFRHKNTTCLLFQFHKGAIRTIRILVSRAPDEFISIP